MHRFPSVFFIVGGALCSTPWALAAVPAAAAAASAPAGAASAPVAAASSPAPVVAGLSHTVAARETLAGICAHYGLASAGCAAVAQANDLQGSRLPAVGTTLQIPLSALRSKPAEVKVVQTVGQVQAGGKAIRAGERLQEKTTLTTGPNSSAVMALPDGSRVTVLPRSVTDIVQSRTYTTPDTAARMVDWFGARLRVVEGAIEAAVNKFAPRQRPLEVETRTTLIGVRGTEFRVAAADKTAPYDRAEVLKGTVSNANTWKRTEVTLQQGEGAAVDPNRPDIQIQPLLPPPAVPKAGQVLRRPDTLWRFSPVAGASAYRVIAAYDPKFETIAYSEKSVTPVVDLRSLSNGTLYLHARAVSEMGIEGQDALATVVLKQPAWTLPGLSVDVSGGRPVLGWTAFGDAHGNALPGTSRLTAEVARTADFSGPVRSLTTSAPQLALPALGYGTYYLRLQLANDALHNDEQQVYRFQWLPNSTALSYRIVPQPVQTLD